MSSSDDFDFEIVANKDLTDYNDAGYLPQEPEVLAEIQEWLDPTKYHSENSEYRKHVNSYLEGTCQWFEKSQVYREWHDTPGVGALWVKAVAGAGKSVLAASTAARLAREEQVPVLFFFFRQIVALNHEPKYLVRDWLSQLLPSSPWLQGTLKEYVKDKKDINTISVDELWRLVCDALSFMPKAYCVADALDEMDDGNEAFLQKLIELGQQKPGSIKLLLTSRPVTRVENILRSHVSQIRLDPDDAESDIDMYVEFQLKPIGGPPTFYETLKPIICARAQGLFLYARLVTDELIEAVKGKTITPADIPKIVESVPESLEDVYNKMLVDHSKRSGVSQEHQLTILQWVTHTTRPLRLIEAAAVMKIIGGAGESLKETKALVRAACGPLLEVLEDETLSVIHHSFTEFLTQKDRQQSQFPIITHEEAHHLMATTCVKYLCSGPFGIWEVREPMKKDKFGKYGRGYMSKAPPQELNLKNPLLEYAMANWNIHANKTHLDEDLLDVLDQFFQQESHDIKSYLDIKIGSNAASTFTLVHVAAWAGVSGLIRHLIMRGETADIKDDHSRTPISYAAERGHTEAVAVLLESGVDPDASDGVGWKPIHYAARANHHKIVRLLLDAGVSAITPKTREHPGRRCGNAKRTTGETAVEYASKSGHTETIIELMPHLEKDYLVRALHWAAIQGRSGVVAALLQSPDVDVDHRDSEYNWEDDREYGYTALFQATKCRSPATMRVLLEKGAATSIKRLIPFRSIDWGVAPREQAVSESLMFYLAGKGDTGYSTKPSNDVVREAFDLLVKAGCDIDEVDETGRTPLFYACGPGGSSSSDYNLLIHLLLNAGADASRITNDGSSILHAYSSGNSAEVIDTLVKHGANVNAIRSSGTSAGTAPIHSIITGYYDDTVLAFLEHNPDINLQDASGQTPLHIRARGGKSPDKILKKLVELGANVNSRDNNGQTPVHALATSTLRHNAESARILLDAGADIDARDHRGRTLMSLSLDQYEPETSAAAVMELGGSIGVRDNEGLTVCHMAVKRMETKLLDFLIKKGADPLATDSIGNTLLHTAASEKSSLEDKKQRDFIEFIIGLGVSPKAKNIRGYTPLHIAAGMANQYSGKLGLLGFFLDPKCGIDVNEPDHYGVRAIHIAASVSETFVVALLNAGADPYALTYENQSILHIAAKARKSNVVGLLTARYRKEGRLDFVNTKNELGQTALHNACRSGRPETVRILLEANADVNIFCIGLKSPLHYCAEILEERVMWYNRNVAKGTRGLLAANFMINDSVRPSIEEDHGSHLVHNDGVNNENQLLRIREIVRLLLARGANFNVYQRYSESAFRYAIQKNCEPMIQELLEAEARNPKECEEKEQVPDVFEIGLFMMSKPASLTELTTIQQSISKRNAEAGTDLVNELTEKVSAFGVTEISREAQRYVKELLRLDHEKTAIDLLRSIGKDHSLFSPRNSENSVIHWLVTMGYADIVLQAAVGVTLEEIRNCDNYTRVEAMEKEHKQTYGSIKPVLTKACARHEPNLHTIKVLVEELGLDINAQMRCHSYFRGQYKDLKSSGPLHILAAVDCWWQLEALEYLLQRGADTEIRDEGGQTPLHVALNEVGMPRKYKNAVVPLLLKYGSDANAVDNEGRSCLYHATGSPHLIRLLATYGANVKNNLDPPLLSAIRDENVEAVKTLIELGAEVNTPLRNQTENQNRKSFIRYCFQPTDLYPLFAAASRNPQSPQSNKENKMEIVKLLLEKGADPYQLLDNETTIIHHAFEENSAIFEPFMLIPNLKLDYRSPTGRTLLLALCQRQLNSHHTTSSDDVKAHLHILQDLIERGADVSATDNDGKGVLHYVLGQNYFNDPHNLTTTLINNFISSQPSLISLRDKAGYTPLHYAFRFRIWATVHMLVDMGANLLDPDPKGRSVLHYLVCVQEGLENGLFQEALAKGADINASDHTGRTPLSLFLEHVPLTAPRTAFPSDPSTPPTDPITWSGYVNSIFALIETSFLANGADVHTKDNEGKGLLHVIGKRVALDKRWSYSEDDKNQGKVIQEMFRWLVAKGLDPRGEDEGQMSALDVAAVMGNEDVLKMFRKDK